MVPLVYNLNSRAVAALVVMHEYHRTLHIFINYLNTSLGLSHGGTTAQLFKKSTGCQGALLVCPQCGDWVSPNFLLVGKPYWYKL